MLEEKNALDWKYEGCIPTKLKDDTILTPAQKSLASAVGAITIVGRILCGGRIVALVSSEQVTIPLVSPPRVGIQASRYELEHLLALVG